jgi:phenylpropionate dioxygenase-like ring-hydroxylating dioxygenase large terminal subunit
MNSEAISSTDIQIRNAWYSVGFSSDFECEKLHQQVITERAVVLWRSRQGEVVAFDDRCCHKRMPLSAGRFVDEGLLECAYHGLCFNSEGQCVRIPSQPGTPIPGRAKLARFPIVEQDGVVWIWPGDPQRVGNILPPPTPEIADPGWERVCSDPILVPSNSVLMIENALDVTHFYPLHEGNVGQNNDSAVPMRLETGEINGCEFIKSSREIDNYEQTPAFRDLLSYPVADSYSSQVMVGPGVILAERSLWPAGKRGDPATRRMFRNVHMFTPINRRSHIYRWVVNMPRGQFSGTHPSTPAITRVKEVLSPVFAQDIWALEKQQKMFELPDDGFEEMFLKADAAMSRGREILYRMQRAEQASAGSAGR